MKRGDIVKGDCSNCFRGVNLEFVYKDDANIHAFVCQKCGSYNYFDKDEIKSLIKKK